jgi:NH3-dependent NAD+ synthetase
MGFTYDELESYLEHRREKLTAPTVTRIEKLWRQSSHKRSMPPIADIGE